MESTIGSALLYSLDSNMRSGQPQERNVPGGFPIPIELIEKILDNIKNFEEYLNLRLTDYRLYLIIEEYLKHKYPDAETVIIASLKFNASGGLRPYYKWWLRFGILTTLQKFGIAKLFRLEQTKKRILESIPDYEKNLYIFLDEIQDFSGYYDNAVYYILIKELLEDPQSRESILSKKPDYIYMYQDVTDQLFKSPLYFYIYDYDTDLILDLEIPISNETGQQDIDIVASWMRIGNFIAESGRIISHVSTKKRDERYRHDRIRFGVDFYSSHTQFTSTNPQFDYQYYPMSMLEDLRNGIINPRDVNLFFEQREPSLKDEQKPPILYGPPTGEFAEALSRARAGFKLDLDASTRYSTVPRAGPLKPHVDIILVAFEFGRRLREAASSSNTMFVDL